MSEQFCAMVDFTCLEADCVELIEFNVMGLQKDEGCISCPHCHRLYQFDAAFLEKLGKLKKLILSVREAEDILGDCSVAVMTANGEVKVPYRLLLTRMNSLLTLDVGGEKVDFCFRIEPIDGSFR